MVGEGGQSLDTFMRIDDLWILKGIISGITRRYRATWEAARLSMSPHCKPGSLTDLKFTWELEAEADLRTDYQRDIDSQRALEAARRAFNLE